MKIKLCKIFLISTKQEDGENLTIHETFRQKKNEDLAFVCLIFFYLKMIIVFYANLFLK